MVWLIVRTFKIWMSTFNFKFHFNYGEGIALCVSCCSIKIEESK